MAGPSQELLQKIAASADPRVPLPIALTMAERESTFAATKRGEAGEYGLFQLLPATVRGADIGYRGPLEALLEPGLNTKIATGYLALLKGRFGTWPVAIRAYNGSGAAAQSYAVGVLQRLPAWDRFVRENLAFFSKAVRSKGAGAAAIVVAAALAVLLLTSKQSEAQA